ncbi:MAG: glycosyltransferase [Okeania sp. SIO3I5]|uniref:glycosyltransferase n=1 Tax=Okeania sp. SIO3I5 TaxID=2607805 RepID=UPI0013BDA346|nr:glycosyltransferase [Okeania sp. SIO3I5]NEQ38353.1 glycosyltransferase [Okeania sp. SIO3I5]
MRIYFYVKVFPPNGKPLDRGISKAVDGLADGLQECGVKVTIFCEGDRDSYCQTDKGVEIRCFANKLKNDKLFFVSNKLKLYIEQYPSDLVILNAVFHPSVYVLSRFLKKLQIPYLACPHDPYHPSIFSKNAHLKWPYWYLLESSMLRQAKAIQVLDIRHGEFLRRLRIKTPVIEVPNGFHPEDVLPESKLQWRKNSPPKLLFLGRIDYYNKGLDLLLEAFAQIVIEKNIDAHLTIQGPDWGDRKMLEKKGEKLGISEKLSFLKPDFRVSPSSIIINYDIFCLPSRFEGFGLSALEAMLAGRVLLVSEVGGIAPHVSLSGCGVVVKSEIVSIKNGLEKLLECRSEWQEMGMAGRRYVLENLHWQQIASTALEEYKQILASSNMSK